MEKNLVNATYTFEVVLKSGNDEYWEEQPTEDEVLQSMKEIINDAWIHNATVKLKKVEKEYD